MSNNAQQTAPLTGVTENTAKNLLLGPGTIHEGLRYDYEYTATSDTTAQSGKTYYTRLGDVYSVADVDTGDALTSAYYERSALAKWNFNESIIGATNGLKLSIKPNIKKVSADGVLVNVKGLFLKRGEEAKMEGSIIELTPSLIKKTAIAADGISEAAGYGVIESKERIEEGDYYTAFAYVGSLNDGTPIIVVFDYAICTSGLEIEGKNDDNAVFKVTIECCARMGSDLSKLPYHIYYPTPSVA